MQHTLIPKMQTSCLQRSESSDNTNNTGNTGSDLVTCASRDRRIPTWSLCTRSPRSAERSARRSRAGGGRRVSWSAARRAVTKTDGLRGRASNGNGGGGELHLRDGDSGDEAGGD